MHPGALSVRIVAIASADVVSRAVGIAVLGMLIVFAALALLTVFLALLPRLLDRIGRVWPETPDRHAILDGTRQLDEEDDVLAAIGFVLHAEIQNQP